MRRFLLLASAALACTLISCSKQEEAALEAVNFTHVRITDDFWQPRMQTNVEVTIPHALEKCESEGRFSNFKRAAGLEEGQWQGHFGFDDSDVYKVLEGMSFTYNVSHDEALRAKMDEIIGWIGAAQREDGYLYTPFELKANDYLTVWCSYANDRYDNLNSSHEFYNMGHMYEAAVAHYIATGQRNFLDIAIKSADHIYDLFGPGKRESISGHQEIEIGLLKLAQATGDSKYAELAKLLLDRRGHGIDGGSAYSQNDVPVTEVTEAKGHSVRANYMYSAMTDIAIQMKDEQYAAAVDRLWNDVVSTKLYLTGGMGQLYDGEAYGEAYYLPNRSYAETCAAIAGVFWNQRMFLLHGESKYIDVLERILYNGLISGISLDGTKFFYPNPLRAERSFAFNRDNFGRAEWFDCSCCPTNDVRFLSSIPGYVYATEGNTIYENLFVSSTATVNVGSDKVILTQATSYPWDGDVLTTINVDSPTKFALKIRIPGWAQGSPIPSDLYAYENGSSEGVTLLLNGEAIEYETIGGYATIERKWSDGDSVEVIFDMPVRTVVANQAVEEDRGKVAIERGPIVYCFEEIDNGDIRDLKAPASDEKFECTFVPDLLGGICTLKTEKLTAVPYCVWDNREDDEMTVWLDR